MNPLDASARIERAYRGYLFSTFAPREPALRAAFSDALASFRLVRGPYLQASPPYDHGASIETLVSEGVLSPQFRRFDPAAFPIERPLYCHQEEAVRKAGARRNLVVATGTGSGKTEAFLVPILDGLFHEADQGTLAEPGVRALLVYPMNALANDQLRRLRRLLAPFPEITFGRYVGETVPALDDAEVDFRTRYPLEPRVPNELLAREQMQHAPPHLLITNYAMLEYLLLRPRDSGLFEGATGGHWRYLVLDEAHVYDGADGAEVGMLVRRVRDRVAASERGRLQCFATSATLGRGRRDYPALAAFATALFDEPVEWSDDDPTRQDVIGAETRPLRQAQPAGALSPAEYLALHATLDHAGAPAPSTAVPLDSVIGREDAVGERASRFATLRHDARLIALQDRLERGPVELPEAARIAFGNPGQTEALVALVDLAVDARAEPTAAPLLPARYHVFLRALEGAFVCLHPRHPSGRPRIRLTRQEWCASCQDDDRPARMFELAACRRCGAPYVVGTLRGQRLESAPPFARLTYLLLDSETEIADEDELGDEDGSPTLARLTLLCPACGWLRDDPDAACGCADGAERPTGRPVIVSRPPPEADSLHRCAACSSRTTGEIVSRVLTGQDAPVAVVATALYQEVPPSRDARAAETVGEGRKILVFSDSRQDAAFFAPYLENTYGHALERALILAAAAGTPPEEPFRTEDLVTPLLHRAETRHVLDPDAGRATNLAEVRRWLLREIVSPERRLSLDGSGVLEIAVAFPQAFSVPRALLELGLDGDEASDLLRMLLDTVRLVGVVTAPDGVDIRDDAFAPRNREYRMRGQSPERPDLLAWLPATSSNRRLDIVSKLVARRQLACDPRELLEHIWQYLVASDSPWRTVFVASSDKRGITWRLSHERFEFRPLSDTHAPYRCDRCAQVWWRTVAGLCPTYRCPGSLRPVGPAEVMEDHYARLSRTLAPIGMAVQEHTAQWTASEGGKVQDDFSQGRINVLSCSTTFELGVDLGDVEAVLLRNVPPTPANYVQRAGRAGRRSGSAALVVTFAQRRNHDLEHFAEPTRMVDGVISPPRIRIDNPTIVRRHVHAVAFAAFLRREDGLRTVADFFVPTGDSAPADQRFIAWLRTRPESVQAALGRVVPPLSAKEIGLDDWSWVESLAATEADASAGWLGRAGDQVRGDLAEIDAAVEEAKANEQFRRAEALRFQENTIKRSELLGFLARRNVLPKYGFPVDVVPLDLARTGDALASRIELDRDLRMAIGEYAPGNQVVAGKALWVSLGLKTQADKAWPAMEWAVCAECGAFREGLTTLQPTCAVCGSERVDAQRSGRYVTPVFGFVGERAAHGPGEARPARWSALDTYFGEYAEGDESVFETHEVRPGWPALDVRVSRHGRLTVVNRGPLGRGYQLCPSCGYGEPAPPPRAGTGRRTRAPSHRDIRRASGRQCSNWLEPAQLGHEFLTDVAEIRARVLMSEPEAWSTLYALLEGAAFALDIKRDEIDGTLHRFSKVEPYSFVVFDEVAGGAGHAQRVGAGIEDVLRVALERVSDCECAVDTSCYSCLRAYDNQQLHPLLTREGAIRVLQAILE